MVWQNIGIVLVFMLLTVISTHLIVKGMILDQSKGDSLSLVYLNMLVALPL